MLKLYISIRTALRRTPADFQPPRPRPRPRYIDMELSPPVDEGPPPEPAPYRNLSPPPPSMPTHVSGEPSRLAVLWSQRLWRWVAEAFVRRASGSSECSHRVSTERSISGTFG